MVQQITVVGLGPAGMEMISYGTLKLLENVGSIYLRTSRHPSVADLEKRGVRFQSFDYLYEQAQTFDEAYRRMVDILLKESVRQARVIFAVPGHPLVAETAVEMLLESAVQNGVEVDLVPAASFVDVVSVLLGINPLKVKVLDAVRLLPEEINAGQGNLICQLYSRMVASEVKLSLMDVYPDDYLVKVVQAAGWPAQERVETVPLFQIDRLDWLDHLTTLYVPPLEKSVFVKQIYITPLVSVMWRLLAPDGCPWDRKQTHLSLRRYLLEEAYEVAEAIDEQDMYKLCEELGDLLLQIVFHACLAEREGVFDLNQVVRTVTEKMISRHPHVFGDTPVAGEEEVLFNWERIKAEERGQKIGSSILDGIPEILPALIKAERVQARVSQIGFDWPSWEGAWAKVKEELAELNEAIGKENPSQVAEETGDLLFAVVNLARLTGVDPDKVLSDAINKFGERFRYIEKKAVELGKELTDMDLQEMDSLWNEAKKRQINF